MIKVKLDKELSNSDLAEDVKEDTLENRKIPKYSKKDFKDLIDQVTSEYSLAYWFMKPKWEGRVGFSLKP